MTVLSLQELQDIFYTITLFNSTLLSNKVRHVYQGNSAPAYERNEDAVYLNVTVKDDPYDKNKHIQVAYTGDNEYGQESTFYTRVIQVDWICHGPHSFNYADDIRNKILTRDVREILVKHHIRPLTDIPAPVRIPYAFNNQWFERTDLTAYFNVGTERITEVPWLKEAVILLPDDEGNDNVFTIEL